MKHIVKRVLRNRCWDILSLWVRMQGADLFRMTNECYTCGKVLPIKELQCGHFEHGKLDFDPRNLKPQCAYCNKYCGGQRIAYTLRLVKTHGVEWVEKLQQDAARKGNNYTYAELITIYNTYNVHQLYQPLPDDGRRPIGHERG